MKTTMGRNWSCGPMWLRQRRLGKNWPQSMQASRDLVRRLNLEASLSLGASSHLGVPMDWNQKGTLLAIAQSGPYLVRVWDVFKQREVCKVDTGYTTESSWSIPTLKYVPNNDAQIIVCRQQGGLRLIDVVRGENSHVSKRSHINDIAVHPSEPNLIWSVRQDGYVECCDVRQARECASYQYQYKIPRRIVINPLHSDVLAVGYRYGYVRLFDRRKLKSGASPPCITQFEPVHGYDHHGLMGLAFSSDGSELLASIHGDQVYLFDRNEPWEKYRSFDLSIKPLLSDELDLTDSGNLSKIRPCLDLEEQRKQCYVGMQDELKTLFADILSGHCTFKDLSDIIDHINKLSKKQLLKEFNLLYHSLTLYIIDHLNMLLDRIKNCPGLYRDRAMVLMRRAHGGDYYQALRDCCRALALKPLDPETICCLSKTLIKLENKEDVCRLLDFVEDTIKKFGDHNDLTRSREMLTAFKERKGEERVTHVKKRARPASEPHGKEADPGSSTRMLDYSRRYRTASISCSKEEQFYCYGVNFFGSRDEFVVGGNERGAFHIWDKNTTNIVATVGEINQSIVLPHPSICMVATSGWHTDARHTVRLWSPIGEESPDDDD